MEADKTVAGVDANNNGIRDDVELAIFNEYPNSAKTRAVLLQYALELQLEVVIPVVNTETVSEVAKEEGRGFLCIGEVLSKNNLDNFYKESDALTNFVENRQINNKERKKAREVFYEKLGSYGESTNQVCDIDFALLGNQQ